MLNKQQIGNMRNKCFHENTGMIIKLERCMTLVQMW